jgi:triosephosphate isomerase
MLADLGVKYVILGHSERRNFMGETNEIINLKIKAALKAKMKVILCVGEKAGEEMNLVVEQQLVTGLSGLSVSQMKDIAIAYEPVWAIGTGNACLPESAQSATLFIKRILTKLYSRFLADQVPVLYGGSVIAENCADYIKISRMNGLLVGGASLDNQEFGKIISNLNT